MAAEVNAFLIPFAIALVQVLARLRKISVRLDEVKRCPCACCFSMLTSAYPQRYSRENSKEWSNQRRAFV